MKLFARILALFSRKPVEPVASSANLDEAMTALGREIAREIDRQDREARRHG